MEQLHLIYYGEVQGIGFRYTVKKIADSLEVKGWIKNLSDGSVELLVQGERETLSKMKNLINNKFYKNFETIDQTKEKAEIIFDKFVIK